MTDPERLVDDPAAPDALRQLLTDVPRARSLDTATQRRIQKRLAAMTAIPVASGAWIVAKTAAAGFGLAAGVTAVGVGAVRGIRALTPEEPAVRTPQRSARPPLPGEVRTSSKASDQPSEQPAREPVRAEFPHAQLRDPRVAAAPAAEAGPTTAATGTAAFPDVADGGSLARETELLERARNALDSDPAASIALTDEHRLRFAQPFLAAECEFIRVEALHRLGRDQEARALAQILIARDTRGLYRERLRRLLE